MGREQRMAWPATPTRRCVTVIPLFLWTESKEPMPGRPLRRSRNDRIIAGVIGGLADYLGLDPTLARVAYVLLSIFSAAFPGILVYILLWIVIPPEESP